jgi:hypothetical protein
VEAYGCGVVVLSCIQTVLVLQKLIHFIDWSWWWVLTPMWIVVAATIALGMYGVFK